ncbi:Cyanovirin-N [Aspergillus eucalypticola CBS 122712]|uniref:Cyanovirin-N n=1 Tax=Aspergillus eucalypticola (strain CBS 122712 / IBT 29274) TaxID=1448314 RepID=A0A317WLQ2_ASPEC|nr:Cyanovirin-N [Aspergillus eucalypticola CBS 122712]PWY85160.1 Cyanovirin-N [Aspergillus eucalypticola CBS 122712]
MSFYRTAEDIRVEEDHWLVAIVANEEGEMVESRFDLNSCIGNEEGRFLWGGNDFAGSAEEISFAIEGEDNVPVLRAKLSNSEGEQFDADVNLAEHITNRNGNLEYQEESLL